MKSILSFVCLLLAANLTLAAEPKKPAEKLPGDTGFSGKVTETMNAASYTYVQIDTGSKKVWAAAPQFQVKVGDSIAIADAMPMPKYHSKVLNRDFDVVYFTANVKVNGTFPKPASASSPTALPQGHPPIGGAASGDLRDLPKDHPPIGTATAKPTLDLKGIKKAEGGATIAEVYAGKTKLSGKEVQVRGKVVKYNSMIMNKNWIHIQDGTGAAGSNDLLVTSTSEAKVGDTVLVTGTLALNKDFGANYKYPVMIENAKVTVER